MDDHDPLPLKSVVLFIACGATAFIIVFIFAKRQITRFALKSRGPHAAIGSDAPKDLRQEINRRLHRVGDIVFEPPLLNPSLQGNPPPHVEKSHFYYRMKALDDLAILDRELGCEGGHKRQGQHTLRTFLLEQRQSGQLEGVSLDLLEKFTDAYVHARHEPAEFCGAEYHDFIGLLNQLLQHIKNYRKQKSGSKEYAVSQPETRESPSTEHTNLTRPASAMDSEVTYRPRRGVDKVAAGVLALHATNSSGSSAFDANSQTSKRSSQSSANLETPL